MSSDRPSHFRSREWLDKGDLYSWLRRAAFKSQGFDSSVYEGRPIIGICNSWSELAHCNAHLRDLAVAVKRGVWQAGGFPLEFPVMSLGEYLMRPTTMLYRNLMSMDVEESILANPLDGVVLLGGCDKTTPALLMGAASADVPAILVTGGPQLKANWRGEELGTCTDCRRYQQELRAGQITEDDWADLQDNIIRGPGHCAVMGTASTMGAIGEALGIALPGNACIPATDARRARLAETSGRRVVGLVKENQKPSDILTPLAFENAIRTLHAIGGSANGIIHLIAIAGRVGLDLPLRLFDDLSRSTPVLADVKPSGRFLMEDLYNAGGIPALMKELLPLLHQDALTVTGNSLSQNVIKTEFRNREVIRTLDSPVHEEGGLAVLTGNLAPDGAIIKSSAASPSLLKHSGRALVFDDHADLEHRIDDPELDVHPEDILILRNSGPVGGPGMPEWGFLPLPKKLLAGGVRDMVRISDARMSGSAFGTVVVHVTPESVIGGPLGAVCSGDIIELDVSTRRLNLKVDDREIDRRLNERRPIGGSSTRGYGWLFRQHVTQADKGCDFDFLQA